MTFLDVLVDGEVVKEAMLLDTSDGEEVVYKGPSLPKYMRKISYLILKESPLIDYVVLLIRGRKYLIIKISRDRHLILGLSQDVNAEEYLDQIMRIIGELRHSCYRNINFEH